jgi:hypothetical protein
MLLPYKYSKADCSTGCNRFVGPSSLAKDMLIPGAINLTGARRSGSRTASLRRELLVMRLEPGLSRGFNGGDAKTDR